MALMHIAYTQVLSHIQKQKGREFSGRKWERTDKRERGRGREHQDVLYTLYIFCVPSPFFLLSRASKHTGTLTENYTLSASVGFGLDSGRSACFTTTSPSPPPPAALLLLHKSKTPNIIILTALLVLLMPGNVCMRLCVC